MSEKMEKHSQNTVRKFYTYIYLDPRKSGTFVYGDYQFDHEPFYVGKGHGNQSHTHLKEAQHSDCKTLHHKTQKIQKLLKLEKKPIIIKVEKNLSEQKAFDLEIWLIWAIGRLDLKNGLLTNLTDGGEGTSGGRAWNQGKTKEHNLVMANISKK